MCVADIAFNMFFNDVKSMVKAGVEANITARSEEDSPGIQIQNREQRTKLKQWLSLGSGYLDCGDGNCANLLHIIVTDPQLIVRGLPGTTNNEMSPIDFAKSLYEMVTHPNRNPVGAPVLPKGAFWPALQVAVAHINPLVPPPPSDASQFVINVRRLTAEFLKICFIPWKKHHEGPGRQSQIPIWNFWASLGASDPHRDINSIALRPDEAIHKAAMDAQQMAMGRDANVSWSLNELQLRNLENVIKYDSLPSDWAIPAQSSGYVLNTYNYVRDIYNGKNNVHKLALLVSIILGCCLPNIHAPQDTHRLLSNQNTRAGTRNDVRSLPWISNPKQRDRRIPKSM
jgi:hypothetical protein